MSKKRKNNPNDIIKPISKRKKIDKQTILSDNYPLFCFKYLSKKSIKKCKDYKFFYDYLNRLQELSSLGWDGIRASERHDYGLEPLPTHKIKPQLPSCVTPDVRSLHVFRANKNGLPFVGLQIENIFRVFFIEAKFGDVYDHD